ncbi:MBL fold metallo-hydrolase [Piscinibacter sakaiensis]|uniref:MBL fold metallo-hydrolase n=1 Tax=Piscinibacter sakaiensis TaxID=1547922 RepID=UPI003AAC9020
MIRFLLSRLLLPLVCLLAAPVAAAADARPVKAVEVVDRVYFVEGVTALGSPANRNFISNAGFVITSDGVVVVDALGSPALAREMIAEIRRLTPLPIRHVIVTHYHADHIYGLQVFKAAGANIIAHAGGKSYLNSQTARLRLEASRDELAPFIDAKTELLAADQWLDKQETVLKVGDTALRILHVGPAHTTEDLVVLVEGTGAMYAGDLVFRSRIPFVGQADSRSWIGSLDRLIDLKPRILIPGHGPVSTMPLEDLKLTRDYLVHLRKTMGDAAAELEPFDEAYDKADWTRFEHLPLFRAANRMNAYNTYLLMEQQGRR